MEPRQGCREEIAYEPGHAHRSGPSGSNAQEAVWMVWRGIVSGDLFYR